MKKTRLVSEQFYYNVHGNRKHLEVNSLLRHLILFQTFFIMMKEFTKRSYSEKTKEIDNLENQRNICFNFLTKFLKDLGNLIRL